jgi:AcrR family transcriptional regulator
MVKRAPPAVNRQSIEERREDVLRAAIAEFATYGLHGGSTERIAAAAGISQPYLFKIFGTKKELFLAATERIYDAVLVAFQVGAARGGPSPMAGMGSAFQELVSDRHELLMMLQGVAAVADPDVRDVARHRFQQLYEFVAEQSGAPPHAVEQFLGYGFYLAFTVSIGLPSASKDVHTF